MLLRSFSLNFEMNARGLVAIDPKRSFAAPNFAPQAGGQACGFATQRLRAAGATAPERWDEDAHS